jgi:dolichyl-phosphate beta-glucosyltransferase
LKDISIILPVYNNRKSLEDNIAYLTEFLENVKLEYEIFIVDDGSKEGELIKKIAVENKCTYIRNENNSGKGFAVKKGMMKTSGKIKIFTDADIPYENESLRILIYKLTNNEADVVIGDRTLVKSSYFKNVSLIRSFGSRFFSSVVWGITSGKFGDTQCGLKGFTAESAAVIFGKTFISGFALDVELLYLAVKFNYRIEKIPVKLRNQSISTVSIIKHGFLMLVDLFRIKLFQIRKKYD